MEYFTLDRKHRTVEPAAMLPWAFWMEINDRRIAATYICGYWVSTVFLGLDHQWNRRRPPLLFETMAFKAAGPHLPLPCFTKIEYRLEGYQRRATTWEQ